MNKQQARAFSLFELMVAVIIISILAAVGGPVYKSYSVKSKMTEVFGSVSKYRDALADAYTQNDLFPDVVADIDVNTYTPITTDVLQLLYYQVSTNKQSAYMHFFTQDIGADDFVLSGLDGTGGVHCRLSIVARVTDTGHIQFYCGQWDNSTVSIPLSLLPKTCQDTDLSTRIS